MSPKQLIITLVCTLGISAGSAALAQTRDTGIPALIDDLNAAQLVEVRDQAGSVVLHGTLKTESTKSAKVERRAELDSPAGGQGDGDISIEIERKQKNGNIETKDELELEVERLAGVAQYELFIDGKRVGSFMTSKAGKAKLELERKSAGW